MKEFKKFWNEISTDKDKLITYLIQIYVNRKKTIDKYDELSKSCKTVDHRDYFKVRSRISTKHTTQLNKQIEGLGKKFFSVYSVKDDFWTLFDKLPNKKYSEKVSKMYWNEHYFLRKMKVIYKSPTTPDDIKKLVYGIIMDIREDRYYLSKISNYRLDYNTYKELISNNIELSKATEYEYSGGYGY